MNYDIVRDTAVGILLRVFTQGAYLNIALDNALRRRQISERGRRFLTQLVYGTTRNKTLCDFAVEKLLRQRLDELPPPILMILRMGVFQSLFLRSVTFPAMVNTSVDLARHRGHAGTARLANAVLRRAPKSLDEITLPDREKDPVRFLCVRYSMPEWIVLKWTDEFGPDQAAELCDMSNTEAPTSLRVNTLKSSTEVLMAELAKREIVAEKRTPIPEEITIHGGPPPVQTKLFQQGMFILQDPASMLPAHLLEPMPGEKVLDMCAAPGGKTTHIAQLARDEAMVVAMDIHPGKLRLVTENAERLDLRSISRVCGDGENPPLAAGFDRVLVDAPCSGIGTLRRHPDLKWRIAPEALADRGRRQTALLRSAVRLCKNDGLIVYSVCTFTREETTEVARAILNSETVVPEDGPQWLEQWKIGPGEYRVLPTKEGLDGFYLIRLRKAS